jgi:hypothetical protein
VPKHNQVAHVVRHLVRQHRQCSQHTQLYIGHEGRGNQDTVAKTMHAVAGKDRPSARLMVGRVAMPVVVSVGVTCPMCVPMVMLMSMVPKLGLVEQKEKHQTQQQH